MGCIGKNYMPLGKHSSVIESRGPSIYKIRRLHSLTGSMSVNAILQQLIAASSSVGGIGRTCDI